MNISGLSISGASTGNQRASGRGAGGKVAEPALRPVSDLQRGSAKQHEVTNRHISNAAESQRNKSGHDNSRFVLSGDGEHDMNRFSFRRDAEYENIDPEAFGVSRAKTWSVDVENNFRIQQCGWRDVYEYRKIHGEPEIWRSNGCISKV